VYSEDNLATQLYKVSLLLEEKIDSRKKEKNVKILVVHHYYTGEL
jgi:hypothetical protein